MSEKSNELIIDPQLLAAIQRQCRQRTAELAAPGSLQQPPDALERTQSVFGGVGVPSSVSEAERFAAAVDQMPARVRTFFEPEEPVPAWRRESEEESLERHSRESFGGWCG